MCVQLYGDFAIVFRIYISNYRINSTSDSYDSIIRWLIPVILVAFDVIPNRRGGPLQCVNKVGGAYLSHEDTMGLEVCFISSTHIHKKANLSFMVICHPFLAKFHSSPASFLKDISRRKRLLKKEALIILP